MIDGLARAPIAGRYGRLVAAELSPVATGIVSLVGLGLVTDLVPDSVVADVMKGILYIPLFFGLAGCGVGWFFGGHRILAASLLALRTILIVIGGVILDLALTAVCDSPCGPSWAADIPGAVIVLGCALCVISLLMPAVSAVALALLLRNQRRSRRTGVAR